MSAKRFPSSAMQISACHSGHATRYGIMAHIMAGKYVQMDMIVARETNGHSTTHDRTLQHKTQHRTTHSTLHSSPQLAPPHKDTSHTTIWYAV